MTAFSIATTALGSSRAAAAAASKQPFSAATTPRAFLNQFRSRNKSTASTASSITSLKASTLAVPDLEKSLDVTHPAYDVIEKDVVTEYGAYCVVYRHKKSGAELLSVSVDDDNKVRSQGVGVSTDTRLFA